MRILFLFLFIFSSCDFAGGVTTITGFDTHITPLCLEKFSNKVFELYSLPDSLEYKKTVYDNAPNLYINGDIYSLTRIQKSSSLLGVYYVQYKNGTMISGRSNISEEEKDVIIEVVKEKVIKSIVKLAKEDGWKDSKIFDSDCPIEYKKQFD